MGKNLLFNFLHMKYRAVLSFVQLYKPLLKISEGSIMGNFLTIMYKTRAHAQNIFSTS